MNRIEERLQQVQKKGEKAFIVYTTAGLPDMAGCARLVQTLDSSGIDVVELGIPFSDPMADGPVIQAASYKSIQQGTNLRKVFDMVADIRRDGCQVPIVFMMYFNTITYYGMERFVDKCIETGVDGLIVPDLPYEEQKQFQDVLDAKENAPILIQLVTPVSGDRIPMLLEHARGFVYCVSSMGVTGQAADFHRNVLSYLEQVKKVSKIPVMMGFGIRTAKDVAPMKHTIDGCIVGSHFINLMEENGYSTDTAREYVETFKKEMNG